MAAPKKNVDRVALEIDYRAGMTFRLMAATYGLSKARIGDIAKEQGWSRDLTGRIKAAAKAKVDAALLDKKTDKKRKKVTEKEIVSANAKMQADIILAHRKDVPLKRELVEKLFKEIEAQTDGQDIIEQMILALASADMGRLANAAQKVVLLPSRIKGTTDLVNAYKTLIGLECEVFGIEYKTDSDDEQQLLVMSRASLERIARGE